MNTYKWTTKFSAALIIALLSYLPINALAEDQSKLTNKIEKVDFFSLAGGRVAIKVQTSQPMANPPAGFTLNNPPRIALDFPGAANGLAKSNLNAGQGVLKSISLAQSKDRTRMVLNLSKTVAYNTTVSGNETTILLQASEASAGATNTVTRFAEAKAAEKPHTLTNIDFERGKSGEGRIMVDLSDTTTGIDIRQKGKTIVVEFINTELAANLERRLNVINFNTPVVYIDTMKQGKNTRMVIEPQGNWEQSAYQADKRFIIDVKPIVEDPNKLVQGSRAGYSGEKLSLNFQNIDVRSVLQVIADFTGFNIITSDTVSGNLTLRLKDVPWDQALDIIMQSKGLSQSKTGNVIWIAPTEEIAAKEKLKLEAGQQIEDMEQLQTEFFTLHYQKADALKTLISDAKQKILSKRGSAVVDVRTNTLFVQDTPRHLEEVQRIINKIDIPVKQVMIESRLVLADERFGRQLGARFGVQKQQVNNANSFATSGSISGGTSAPIPTPTGPLPGSNQLATNQGLVGVVDSATGRPDLNVNLPVTNAFGSFAFSLFRLPAGFLLNLELSALETDNRGKIISSPRVTTADQKKATIAQGTQIPYLEASSSGAATVAFKDAVLSLAVTPQITPDNKIIMDLEVKKDKIGVIFAGVPSIDTQSVITQVLVANGETAVLGGIYEQTERTDIDKVPLFGDLPFVGNLFKHTTRQNDKTELLIFITPKVLDEDLNLR
jgi:type IV pilus assembly protein PilQ